MRRAGARSGTRGAGLLGVLVSVCVLLAACSGSTTHHRSGPAPGPVPPALAWQPDRARMPADAPPVAAVACALARRPDGWLRMEDSQPGDPAFRVPADGVPGQVVGYADRRSATCGDAVRVSLSGPAGVVRVEAYRVGAYPNAMARLVWRSPDVAVRPRPLPALQPRTRMREAAWPVSAVVPVSAAWPPGFYLLVARAGGRVAGPAIPLVVRDDADHEQALFVASTLTWNAYNDWGGYSLYRGPGGSSSARFASRAVVTSFRRPLAGSGYRQLVFMDLPVVRQLERTAADAALDVAYTTDVDVDRYPSRLLHHAELVFGGHSEYWTRREYDAVASARSFGVNLAFLGANNLWWHARLDTSPGAPEPDREIVYRVLGADPGSRNRSGDYTLLWSQWPEHRDAAALLGHSHAGIGVHGGYQLLRAPGWLLAGTSLVAGTPEHPGSTLPGAVGNEADGYNPLAANPRNLTVLAVGVLRGSRGPVTASASYYVAPSGAGVFAAGSTDWSCGLEGQCFDQVVPEPTSAALRAITRNVVLAFAQTRAGRSHPSVPSVTPPPAALLKVLDPAAVGSYGGAGGSEEAGVGRHVTGAAGSINGM